MCHIIDISQGGVVFQKQLQKHVISGPFGLFYVPHNFPIRRNWSGSYGLMQHTLVGLSLDVFQIS